MKSERNVHDASIFFSLRMVGHSAIHSSNGHVAELVENLISLFQP